jgi:hypothetical protein
MIKNYQKVSHSPQQTIYRASRPCGYWLRLIHIRELPGLNLSPIVEGLLEFLQFFQTNANTLKLYTFDIIICCHSLTSDSLLLPRLPLGWCFIKRQKTISIFIEEKYFRNKFTTYNNVSLYIFCSLFNDSFSETEIILRWMKIWYVNDELGRVWMAAVVA